jgi:hypothetical protein
MASSNFGFGQAGAGPEGLLVVSRQIIGMASVAAFSTQLFQVVDTYSDGTQVALAAGSITWSVDNPAVATIGADGTLAALKVGAVTVSAAVTGDQTYTLPVTATPRVPVSIAVTAGTGVLLLSAQVQAKAVATYGDNTTADVTSLCTWSSNSVALSVSATGLVTAVRMPNLQAKGNGAQFAPAVVAYLAGASGTCSINVVATVEAVVAAVAPGYRSHRTQVMLNYFDITDQRVREEPYTIDAQLLNTAAMALDDSQLRISREIAARTLGTCPIGLDNQGVYFKVALPNDFVVDSDQTELQQVTGSINGGAVTVRPYDDRCPVPSSYIADPVLSQVSMANPILFDVTGSGDSTSRIWNPVQLGPYSLATPNRLTFWAEGVEGSGMNLDIFVQGDEFPLPVWADQQEGASETLTASDEGVFTGTCIWQNVSSIIVRGLPAGVRLRCWQMSFNLPAVPDAARPFTHPRFRDVLFDRYWHISKSTGLLKELFMMDNYSTLEYVQSYAPSVPLNAICVEPNTWGILSASGANLMYWDRREPLPGQLDVTALNTEPLYGVDVQYDITKSGTTRYVAIRPVAYGSATLSTTWRYVLAAPDGTFQVIQPDGSFAAYSGSAGWQSGAPVKVSVPLVQTGPYVISLECMGSNRVVTADEVPYPNLAVPSTNVYDLSWLVSAIKGIAYDAFGQLWIWTGAEAVPIRPRYDSYVLDPVGRALYLTDKYDSVSFE